ncbi:MAG: CRISPR-associated helicase Cas3' [Acidobacteria bacterium]|nr:CRISPR-associated helicase Cas3' [Acidobacteriota bacterium]
MSRRADLRLEAHPGEPLLVHLASVGAAARRLASFSPVFFDPIPCAAIAAIAHLAGFTHDLGKATAFFQDYLHAPPDRARQLKADPRTRHALLGAVVAWALYGRSDLARSLAGTPAGALASIIAPWAVRRHHGRLGSPGDDLVIGDRDVDILREQIESAMGPELDLILAGAGRRTGLGIDRPLTGDELLDRLQDLVDDLGIEATGLSNSSPSAALATTGLQGLSACLLVQRVLSVLLEADRSYSLKELRSPLPDRGVGPACVSRYRASRFGAGKCEIDQLRARAAAEAIETLEAAAEDASVFRLTLPTGLGKTLVGLDAAVRLAARQQCAGHRQPAIVYALPFVSVLEQTEGVLETVAATALGGPPIPGDVLVSHHHRAEFRYPSGGEDEYTPNQSQLLVEGWRSSMVLTTTVQLFESLFSGRTRTTRKLHRLAGSVVVLDEVQALPFRFWPAIREMLAALVERLGAKILLVTATEPRFLEARIPAVELVPRYREYFGQLDRTRTHLDMEPRDLESLATIFAARLQGDHAGQSALVVVNTVAAAIDLSSRLSALVGPGVDVVSLSTNLVPAERARRIADAARRDRRRPLVLVSTQLVEAGVDLSFPVVFRDLAPVSSIVQAAGRCNRHWEKARGDVYVFTAVGADGRPFADVVYDPVELSATREVLRRLAGGTPIDEPGLLTAVDAWFERMRPSGTAESERALAGARRLCFRVRGTGGQVREELECVRLIEDRDTAEVFVEIDDAAEAAWREFERLRRQRPDRWATLEQRMDHSAGLRAATRALAPWRLSIGKGHLGDLDSGGEIVRVVRADVVSRYDMATGWRRAGAVQASPAEGAKE